MRTRLGSSATALRATHVRRRQIKEDDDLRQMTDGRTSTCRGSPLAALQEENLKSSELDQMLLRCLIGT
jgi:hypothetical protein